MYSKIVFKEGGVNKPIFVIPLPIKGIENLLNTKHEPNMNKEYFKFFTSCAPFYRKDIHGLLDAFTLEFDKNEKVKLIIHCRDCLSEYNVQELEEKYQNDKRIEFILKTFDRSKYESFLNSMDCLALVSMGEGYSITPREVLALGIPCILSDNSAHKTICNTNFVRAVPSKIKVEDTRIQIANQEFLYKCSTTEIRKALRDVYSNYNYYLELAIKAKEWIKQYTTKNLSESFESLINPKKIQISNDDLVQTDCIYLTSSYLKEKYEKILNLKFLDNQN